jgi:hypothetical protein
MISFSVLLIIMFRLHIQFILISVICVKIITLYHDLYTGNIFTGFINKGHELHGFL